MTTTTTMPSEMMWVLCSCTKSQSEYSTNETFNFDDNVLITFTNIDDWPVDVSLPILDSKTTRNFVFASSRRKHKRHKRQSHKS